MPLRAIDAGGKRYRPVHGADDVGDRNLLRRARQAVAAGCTPVGFHQARRGQQLHEFGDSGGGDAGALGKLRNGLDAGAITRHPRHHDHRVVRHLAELDHPGASIRTNLVLIK